MEQSLTTTQEQLSQRVGEVVRLEQNNRKLSTELKTMKERCQSYEDEMEDQKETIGTDVIILGYMSFYIYKCSLFSLNRDSLH